MNARRPLCPLTTLGLLVLAALAASGWIAVLVPDVLRPYPPARVAGGAAAVALLALAVALQQQASVGARLRLVRTAIHRLVEGDFGGRLQSRGRDEVSATMRAVDDLAGLFQARLEATRVAERRYRRLFENNPAGMFRTRPDGRVVDCNPAAVAILGYPGAVEVKTRHASDFYADPGDRERVLERLAREDALINLRLRFRRKDGREIPVLLNIARTSDLGETYFEGQFLDLSTSADLQDLASAR